MRKRKMRSADSEIVFAARSRRLMLGSTCLVSTQALCCAAALSLFALSASSPASAQFMCTTTATDRNCTNSGTAATAFTNLAPQLGQNANANATTTNSGTAVGFTSTTTGGGNATATNSGTNTGSINAATTTIPGGNATASNSGTNGGNINAATTAGGNATATNSGSNAGSIQVATVGGGNATATNSSNNGGDIEVATVAGGNATATNSGFNAGSIQVATVGSGNATATNSGTNGTLGGSGGGLSAVTVHGGDATVVNSGTNFEGGLAAVTEGGGNASVTNSGTTTGTTGSNGLAAVATGTGNATATNSGTVNGFGGPGVTAVTLGSGNAAIMNSGSVSGLLIAVASGTGNSAVTNSGTTTGIEVIAPSGSATLTNIVGGRVLNGSPGNGLIALVGATNTINFVGGNWLFTVVTNGNPTTINTGGAPFVVGQSGKTGLQIAVLDATTFALADRSLTNFTGEISEMLQGRFGDMSTGGVGGGALGFAGAPSSPLASEAQAAFSGIPSVAMSYASDASRPVLGKAPAASLYYDTTIWASGFGGERHQRADGLVLRTDDTAFGGAMGVDRIVGPNLRLGAFVGAGASREAVELDVQKIDSTYVFGGAYGRFDWISQYFDFALYGGGIDNKSTRQIANNTVASGLETATASYGGWFISPEVTYGYRIPVNAITVSPRVRLRYVGGQLDGYSESGSMQNLSVGRRSINDLEERGELEFSTASGALKAAATVGVIGLERLGNPTINTVLLAQNLSFTTPGQANAFGGVFGMRLDYRAMANVALFVAGEGTVMSDKSQSFAATGGARVSF